ncbi:hypothetical protein KQX54_011460 [Cotesia glomerata]|uniref:Guanine nucleotide-binding protein-like 1 n=1 Tax=Cotesia glomerata TaxID=32391 RepID=A0AAV7I495_COTGL|nr:hypothetical protein KQX54_011460 [Cotesia glomerata]
MPKRPEWDYNMSKEQLDMREHEYFMQYIEQIKTLGKISYFELNLETWRQLWRVLEMSDILLILVDVRYSVLMFPPYLYNYITNDLKKEVILVINKVDLAPPALVLAWREYFSEHYPQLRIVHFTSYPVENLQETLNRQTTLNQHKRKGKFRMVSAGAQALLKECQEIVLDNVDLSSWQEKINKEINLDDDCDTNRKDNIIIEKNDTSFVKHDKYANRTLTIGCIGHPNVGKSAFMNAVIGNKVVSISRTPGHTKHFQTIFLTENVRFCDCPGLVFPSTVPKQLQILMGSFPISQVREPYTVVKYLAQRIDLPKILKIQHQQNDDTWSAMDICDSWAAKRHFMTARTGKFDTYRAANSLLRMALEGKICIFVYPPGWTLDRGNII